MVHTADLVWCGISEVPLGPNETVYKRTKYVFDEKHHQDCKRNNCSTHQDGGQIIHIKSGLRTKKITYLLFADQLRQDRRFWQAVRGVVHAELGANLMVGCLIFTEKAGGGGAERVTPSSPVSTADQTMIPSGPQPGGQERGVTG